jgi:acetyl esterase/lipase
MQATSQAVGAVAGAAWASHAAFAAADTPASQTMLSFLPTLAVSELSPQLLAFSLVWLARGGFGDGAAVRAAISSLCSTGTSSLTFAQACALASRLAGIASIIPLAVMARNVFTARTVCAKALERAGVPAPLTNQPPSMLYALVSALPTHEWLRWGIESQTSITYGRAPASVSHRRGVAQELKYLKLDLLWHSERKKPNAPVLMYCHGGGWVIGSRKRHSVALLLAAARAGWLVATVDYRLAPRVAFPNMLYDCKEALAWLRQHASAYGGDPSFIAVAGESAGGHLALMLGLTPNVAAYQPSVAPGADTSVQAVVDLYGVADWTDSRGAYSSRWRAPGTPAGIVPFIEALVLRRSYADHTHEFVRASPLWWVHGETVRAALSDAGVEIAPVASKVTERVPPDVGAVDQAEDEAVELEGATIAHLVHHRADHSPYRGVVGAESDLIEDMAVNRTVPPCLLIHGTADTVVPHAGDGLRQCSPTPLPLCRTFMHVST